MEDDARGDCGASAFPGAPFSRAVLTARAAVRHDPKYMLPDGELAVFDRDGPCPTE